MARQNHPPATLRFYLMALALVSSLLISTGLLAASSNSAPLSFSDAALSQTISGSYFNPDRSGEGCLLTREGDGSTYVLSCYMYADGEQFWAIGTGQLQNGEVIFPQMVTTRGADYGEFFDPAAVETLPFGTVTVQFADCNEALFRVDPVIAGFPSVGLPMQRVIPVSCNQGVPSPANGLSAGTWFNPSRSGEGFQLTVEGDQDLHVLAFYTFLDGEQAWMIGPGTRAGNRIQFDVIVTLGTGFGPEFNPAQVVTIPAGTIIMDFQDCNTATIRTQSVLEEFPNLQTEVVKIIPGTCDLAGGETFVFEPQDPYFFAQWHLFSDGQPIEDFLPAPARGADVNLIPLWQNCPIRGCQGEGVVVAVVDDGLDIRHPDLIDNISQNIPHRDVTVASGTPGQDPSPIDPERAHGTAVGGLIAARDNDIGVVGVASRATLIGINLLRANDSASDAEAMIHARDVVSISNNSWGPPDGTGFLNQPEQLWQQAIELGIRDGLGGRGIVYIWAGGNGHRPTEDGYFSDFSGIDGQANFHGVLTVAAANADDRRSSYSEWGSNLLVTGFGGEFCGVEALTMATTDLSTEGWGYNNEDSENADTDFRDRRFTRCFNGTSAASPTVAGVVALMREANPNLSWRDVRWILAHNARQIDPDSDNWSSNGAGLTYNWEYGFGAVDAAASVQTAREMTVTLPPYLSRNSSKGQVGPIEAGASFGATAQFASGSINRIEFVTAHVRIDGGTNDFDAGDLFLTLTSPAGVTALLTPNRRCTEEDPETEEELWVFCENSIDFSFGSVQFLGEDPNGTWLLNVDAESSPRPATLADWSLTIHGHHGN